jgi:MFS family permease
MHFIPAVILAPFSGAYVDRIHPKKLMMSLMIIELCMTLGFLTIKSLDDVWLLMLLLFIRMGSASMFFTTQMSLLPKIINGIALQKANEIHSIIWSFTFSAGMALGGVAVYKFGVYGAILIDSIFFMLSILIFNSISFNITHTVNSSSLKLLIKDGYNYIKSHKKILHIILLHSSVGFTSFDTIVTLLANYHYKYIIAISLSIGLTNASRSLALMVGPFIFSKFINDKNLFYIFILQGSFILLWAFIQKDFYIGIVGIFFVGICTTTIW